jgi:hypothetical protein
MPGTRRPHFDRILGMAPTIRFPILRQALWQLKPIGWAVLGTVSAIGLGAIVYLSSAKADLSVRCAGMLFQLFGLFTVAYGLWQARQLFGRPGFLSQALDWVQLCASAFDAPKSTYLHVGTGLFIVGGSEAHAVGRSSGQSLEDRVSELERDREKIRKEIAEKDAAIRKNLAEVTQHFDKENQERRKEIDRASRATEELGTGGLHIDWMGLVWLVFGVILTSIPDEIAFLLRLTP